MRTLSRILGTGLIIAGSLSMLTGCDELKKLLGITTQKTAQQATGEKDAYKKAVDIANNPSSVFNTGNAIKDVPATQLPARNSQSLERNLGIQDYFLQGKELEILKPKSVNGFSYSSNPCVLSPREVAAFEQENFRLFLDGIQEIGLAAYAFPDRERGIEQYILKFETEKDNWAFLNGLEMNDEIEMELGFINGTTSSVFTGLGFKTIEEERDFYSSIAEYAERVGGAFYSSLFNSLEETEKMYRKIGIPIKNSARALAKALKFQNKMYDMDSSQLSDVYLKELGFQSVLDKVKRYNRREISREELEEEMSIYGKKDLERFFFTPYGLSLDVIGEKVPKNLLNKIGAASGYVLEFFSRDIIDSFLEID